MDKILEWLFGDLLFQVGQGIESGGLFFWHALRSLGSLIWDWLISNVIGSSMSGQQFNLGATMIQIAGYLALFFVIYGFVIENLDFHTYDGWDRVIRLLIRCAIIIPLTNRAYIIAEYIGSATTAFKSMIMSEVYQGVSGTGTIFTSTDGTETTTNFFNMYVMPSFDRICNDEMWDSLSSLEDSFGARLGGFALGGPLVALFLSAIVRIIVSVFVVIVGVMIVKKVLEIAQIALIPVIEFKILYFFAPVAIAFYGSHATQHVGQSYLRNLLVVGMENAIRLLILVTVYTKLGWIWSSFSAIFTSWHAGVDGNSLGFEVTIGTVLLVFIKLSLVKTLFERTNSISAKVFN